jgi:hypothetical protein
MTLSTENGSLAWSLMLTKGFGEEVRKICGFEFGSFKIQLNRFHVEWTRISPSGYASQVYKVLQAALFG